MNELKNDLETILKSIKQKAIEPDQKTEEEEMKELYAEIINSHRIPQKYYDADTKDYSFKKDSQIAGYLRNLKHNTKNGIGVFLNGVCGTGKTRFCYAILKRYIWTYIHALNAHKCKFISFKGLQDSIINADDKEQAKLTYAGYTLLIIDEFCVDGELTTSEKKNLLEILNIRNNNIPCGKPTVFTSNQSITQIRKLAGEAIYDRIIGNCVIHEMNSKSRRTIENRIKLD